MQTTIKLHSKASNIIKTALFNFSPYSNKPSTIHHTKKAITQHNLSHKQISPYHCPPLKYHFSTTPQSPIHPSQMQPQLKPISSQKLQLTTTNQQNTPEPLTQDDPFPSYDDELFDELAKQQKTQKDIEQHKLRSQKRKQKLQKIRAELKDPEYRRQRNRQRHQRQKQKLQKNLLGLQEQQIKQYLVNRKQLKLQKKQKVKEAVEKQIGQPFLIDIAFAHCMNEKENKSLAIQIQLIVKALKQIDPPPNVHLCGLKEGITKSQLIGNRFDVWPIKSYQQPLEECLAMEKFKNKKVYYLSPDSTKTLDTIEPDSIFIIGGLVDRTVIKNASLNRARDLNIEARSLPIRPFMKQRSCLNLDHIVMIMCKYMQVKDWKVAFEHGAPKRWKKGEGQKGLKELKSSSDQEQNN